MSQRHFFCIIICSFIAGCGHRTTQQYQWDELDSLCQKSPGEALVQLDSMGAASANWTEDDCIRWALLRTKAQDKAFIPHTTDSVMKCVVAYYEGMGSVVRRAEAHYYLASVYRDLHDSPRSVTHFLEALDLLETADHPDAGLMMRCCSQMRELFDRQLNHEKALEIAKRGVEIGRRYQILTPSLLADVAITQIRLGDTTSALGYYEEALKMIQKEGLTDLYNSAIVAELLPVYSSCHKRSEADSCLVMLQSLRPEDRPLNYQSCLANYFENVGMVDSAIVSHRRLLENPEGMYSKQEAARSLMTLYAHQGRQDSSSYYGLLYAEASDSVDAMLKREVTQNMVNEYQYRRDLEAEAAAYRAVSQARVRWLMTILVAVILLLMGVIYIVNRKRLFAQQLLVKEKRIHVQQQEIAEQARALTEAMEVQKKEKQKNRYLTQQMRLSRREALPDELLERFRKAGKGLLNISSDTEWQQLMVALDDLYPDFSRSVMERYPGITHNEMHIVCLLKMGMNTGEIMNATSLNKSTFYRLLKQVKDRLTEFA